MARTHGQTTRAHSPPPRPSIDPQAINEFTLSADRSGSVRRLHRLAAAFVAALRPSRRRHSRPVLAGSVLRSAQARSRLRASTPPPPTGTGRRWGAGAARLPRGRHGGVRDPAASRPRRRRNRRMRWSQGPQCEAGQHHGPRAGRDPPQEAHAAKQQSRDRRSPQPTPRSQRLTHRRSAPDANARRRSAPVRHRDHAPGGDARRRADRRPFAQRRLPSRPLALGGARRLLALAQTADACSSEGKRTLCIHPVVDPGRAIAPGRCPAAPRSSPALASAKRRCVMRNCPRSVGTLLLVATAL